MHWSFYSSTLNSSSLSLTSALDGGGWSTPRPGCLTHRNCIGGWVGPSAGLDGCRKSRPHRDSIPGPSSLYYTDWAILAYKYVLTYVRMCIRLSVYIYVWMYICKYYIGMYICTYVYRVSQEERTKLRESVPYVKLYRYNPKHLYPKLNG